MRPWVFHLVMAGLVALALAGLFAIVRRDRALPEVLLALGGTVVLLFATGLVLAVFTNGAHFGAVRLLAWLLFL